MNKTKKLMKKNIGIVIGVVLVLIIGGYFIFENNILAWNAGIDVKYLDNLVYCEKDSDCYQKSKCRGLNIHYAKLKMPKDYLSYPMGYEICDVVVKGSVCIENSCRRYMDENHLKRLKGKLE